MNAYDKNQSQSEITQKLPAETVSYAFFNFMHLRSELSDFVEFYHRLARATIEVPAVFPVNAVIPAKCKLVKDGFAREPGPRFGRRTCGTKAGSRIKGSILLSQNETLFRDDGFWKLSESDSNYCWRDITRYR
jgi:hypothetical protein